MVLCSQEGNGRLCIKHVPKLKASLITSQTLVICDAPPPHYSTFMQAKRMFTNLKTDHEGPEWPPNLTETCIRKQKTVKPTPSVIDVNASDSDPDNTQTTTSWGDKIGSSPKNLARVVLPCRTKLAKVLTVIQLSSDSTSLSESEFEPDEDKKPGSWANVGIIKDAEGHTAKGHIKSKYEQEASSCKCKMKVAHSSHSITKRATSAKLDVNKKSSIMMHTVVEPSRKARGILGEVTFLTDSEGVVGGCKSETEGCTSTGHPSEPHKTSADGASVPIISIPTPLPAHLHVLLQTSTDCPPDPQKPLANRVSMPIPACLHVLLQTSIDCPPKPWIPSADGLSVPIVPIPTPLPACLHAHSQTSSANGSHLDECYKASIDDTADTAMPTDSIEATLLAHSHTRLMAAEEGLLTTGPMPEPVPDSNPPWQPSNPPWQLSNPPFHPPLLNPSHPHYKPCDSYALPLPHQPPKGAVSPDRHGSNYGSRNGYYASGPSGAHRGYRGFNISDPLPHVNPEQSVGYEDSMHHSKHPSQQPSASGNQQELSEV
ncbi:hypothetical protein V8B97DRAFT_2110564 [Scleroderma yunnanense]